QCTQSHPDPSPSHCEYEKPGAETGLAECLCIQTELRRGRLAHQIHRHRESICDTLLLPNEIIITSKVG
ncbi:hypothetical protein GBAR_LOCUS4213, partial [Geodia barretti]